MASYHGTRNRKMFFYDTPDPPNLHKWDFIDPIKYVCSNYTQIEEDVYVCDGHEDGDKFYPSYHGDPERENRFWAYQENKKLINPEWDFYSDSIPCNNYEILKEGNTIEMQCRGHHQSFHPNGKECSGTKKCPGHD